MVSLPQNRPSKPEGGGCGSCGGDEGGHCGAGLEKIYPTTAVRYGAMNYIGEFTYKPGSSFRCGGRVVIQTDRGIELGSQVSLFCNGCSNQVTREQIKGYIEQSGPEFYRLNAGRIIREATPADGSEHDHLNSHIRDDLERCALLAMQLDLPMKIVTCEHLLGGERIIFYFRSDDRVDFRELVRLLAGHYRTRIELRQVGARDEARLVADYEICGRECCCKNFLKKLRPVSMKMAKVQKATLDPSKVSGRCGRLRCCLRYEHEGYEALLAKLPRMNSRVRTTLGDGDVVDRQVLTQLVMVQLDDQRRVAVPVEEILQRDLPLRPPPSSDAPPEFPVSRSTATRREPPSQSPAIAPADAPRSDSGSGVPTEPVVRDERIDEGRRGPEDPKSQDRRRRHRNRPPRGRHGPPAHTEPPAGGSIDPGPDAPRPPGSQEHTSGESADRGGGSRRRRRRRRGSSDQGGPSRRPDLGANPPDSGEGGPDPGAP